MEKIPVKERQTLAGRVGNIQSACVAVAWALDLLATDAQPLETESERFELITGMSFILEMLAQQLGNIYGQLSEE
jgi:hypothetical protein